LPRKSNEYYYTIFGIASYGSTYCGYSPGVYTLVEKYLDWIENIVWPGDVEI
jgi:secreted trypsin-like serine protease